VQVGLGRVRTELAVRAARWSSGLPFPDRVTLVVIVPAVLMLAVQGGIQMAESAANRA
jgi:hypothetical protein